jgi:hypothetical protein
VKEVIVCTLATEWRGDPKQKNAHGIKSAGKRYRSKSRILRLCSGNTTRQEEDYETVVLPILSITLLTGNLT